MRIDCMNQLNTHPEPPLHQLLEATASAAYAYAAHLRALAVRGRKADETGAALLAAEADAMAARAEEHEAAAQRARVQL
jgi:hypothetical protein